MNLKLLVYIMLIIATYSEARVTYNRHRKDCHRNHSSNQKGNHNSHYNSKHHSDRQSQSDHHKSIRVHNSYGVEEQNNSPLNDQNHHSSRDENLLEVNANKDSPHMNQQRISYNEEFADGFSEGFRLALNLTRRRYGTSTTTTTTISPPETPSIAEATTTKTESTTTTNPCINYEKEINPNQEQLQQNLELECQTPQCPSNNKENHHSEILVEAIERNTSSPLTIVAPYRSPLIAISPFGNFTTSYPPFDY